MEKKLNVKDEALRRLSYRLYSTLELTRHLKNLDYNDSEIEETVHELTENQYLDDKGFVENYVSGRGMRRLMSLRALEYELKAIVGQTPWLSAVIREAYHVFNGGEDNVLTRILEKKNARSIIQDSMESRKLVDYLRKKGFTYENILNAMEQLKAD